MENNSPNVSWVRLYRKQIWIGVSSLVVIIFGIMLGLHFSKHAVSPSPSPIVAGLATTEATATPMADRTTISILVKNGTGIAGEAGYLQGVLKTMGYSNISITDADTSDNTDTSVTYLSSVDKSISDEITQKLKGIYQVVDTNTSSSQTQDVVIITGLKVGQTPLPASTATPAPTNIPTATVTPTPTSSCSTSTNPTDQTPTQGNSTISGGGGVPADSTSPMTVTITLKDTNGNIVQGATVSPQNTSQLTFMAYASGTNVTDTCGQTSFNVTSNSPGDYSSIQVNGNLNNGSTFSLNPINGTLTFGTTSP